MITQTSARHARCEARIDLSALHHNFHRVRAALPAGVRVAAVLKADAYGHGLSVVAESLRSETGFFAVANLTEAREVRSVAPQADVLILGPALPGERGSVVAEGFEVVVSTAEEAADYAAAARARGREARLHLAVDSGMGRIGIWHEEALYLARHLIAQPNVLLLGIGSHLPSADSDRRWTEEVQLPAWRRLAQQIAAEPALHHIPLHLLNSAGILLYGKEPVLAGAFARAGLALYGSSPLPEYQRELRPAMTLATGITLIRDLSAGRGISYSRTYITPRQMRVGTLAAGYGDGYPRHLSGGSGAEVLVGGRRCAVLGRVTMDQIVVDLSGVPEAAEGDEAILIGRQGEEEITAAELAEKAGTIAWEIFTGITRRVPRIYNRSGA